MILVSIEVCKDLSLFPLGLCNAKLGAYSLLFYGLSIALCDFVQGRAGTGFTASLFNEFLVS